MSVVYVGHPAKILSPKFIAAIYSLKLKGRAK